MTLTIYTTHTCPYCKMLRAWLDEQKIDHKEVFVDDDPDAAFAVVEKSGQYGVPLSEIHTEDGKTEYILGFQKDRLAKLLKAKA